MSKNNFIYNTLNKIVNSLHLTTGPGGCLSTGRGVQGSDPFFLYGLYTSAGVRVFINLVLVLGCIVKYFIE